MKKMLKQLSKLKLFVMPVSVLLFCSWENPGMNNYANRSMHSYAHQTDTLPKEQQDEFQKAMQQIDKSMAEVDKQTKEINVNIDKQIQQTLSSIDFETTQKQTEKSFKQIDLAKMQQDVNVSMKLAHAEIAKIDFTKMQNEMKDLQDKLKSDEFKAQFNSEKMHKQIREAMEKSKIDMEKAKQHLQQMKTFTDALAAEGLITKKKGYNIEWKNGDLYINNQKQSKDIADKYRKYESSGKIKTLPEDAEHF